MTDPRNEWRGAPESADLPDNLAQYPVNRVVAIVDERDQLAGAVDSLTNAGFLATEIDVAVGANAADRLDATPGHTGLAGLAIRIAERLGAPDDEMLMKERYEQSLREGRFLVSVLASTDERKELAARILQDHGAHFINFLGRFTIETLQR